MIIFFPSFSAPKHPRNNQNAHLNLELHSIWETFIFHLAVVVVVPIVNANVEAVADLAFST